MNQSIYQQSKVLLRELEEMELEEMELQEKALREGAKGTSYKEGDTVALKGVSHIAMGTFKALPHPASEKYGMVYANKHTPQAIFRANKNANKTDKDGNHYWYVPLDQLTKWKPNKEMNVPIVPGKPELGMKPLKDLSKDRQREYLSIGEGKGENTTTSRENEEEIMNEKLNDTGNETGKINETGLKYADGRTPIRVMDKVYHRDDPFNESPFARVRRIDEKNGEVWLDLNHTQRPLSDFRLIMTEGEDFDVTHPVWVSPEELEPCYEDADELAGIRSKEARADVMEQERIEHERARRLLEDMGIGDPMDWIDNSKNFLNYARVQCEANDIMLGKDQFYARRKGTTYNINQPEMKYKNYEIAWKHNKVATGIGFYEKVDPKQNGGKPFYVLYSGMGNKFKAVRTINEVIDIAYDGIIKGAVSKMNAEQEAKGQQGQGQNAQNGNVNGQNESVDVNEDSQRMRFANETMLGQDDLEDIADIMDAGSDAVKSIARGLNKAEKKDTVEYIAGALGSLARDVRMGHVNTREHIDELVHLKITNYFGALHGLPHHVQSQLNPIFDELDDILNPSSDGLEGPLMKWGGIKPKRYDNFAQRLKDKGPDYEYESTDFNGGDPILETNPMIRRKETVGRLEKLFYEAQKKASGIAVGQNDSTLSDRIVDELELIRRYYVTEEGFQGHDKIQKELTNTAESYRENDKTRPYIDLVWQLHRDVSKDYMNSQYQYNSLQIDGNPLNEKATTTEDGRPLAATYVTLKMPAPLSDIRGWLGRDSKLKATPDKAILRDNRKRFTDKMHDRIWRDLNGVYPEVENMRLEFITVERNEIGRIVPIEADNRRASYFLYGDAGKPTVIESGEDIESDEINEERIDEFGNTGFESGDLENMSLSKNFIEYAQLHTNPMGSFPSELSRRKLEVRRKDRVEAGRGPKRDNWRVVWRSGPKQGHNHWTGLSFYQSEEGAYVLYDSSGRIIKAFATIDEVLDAAWNRIKQVDILKDRVKESTSHRADSMTSGPKADADGLGDEYAGAKRVFEDFRKQIDMLAGVDALKSR